MTLEDLKSYTKEQQMELYLLFYGAFTTAPAGSPKYHQYRMHLEQLRIMFGHNHAEHAKLLGECAAKLFLATEVLEMHLGENV